MEEVLNNKIGKSFPTPVYIFGIVLSIIGIGACFSSPVLGVILILVGAFVWSNYFGMEIDTRNQTYREYSSAFGMKYGSWLPMNTLPYVSVLMIKEGMTVYSRSNRSTTISEERYGAYFLSKNHREKILIGKYDKKEEAMNFAQELASVLQKDLVT